MERSSVVPLERSVSTRGWRNQCHKMIHNGKTCWKFTSYNIFVKEHWDFLLKPKVLDPHIPSKKLICWEVHDFENKTLKYLSEKQNLQWAGTWGAYCLARTPMGLERCVRCNVAFAMSSDKSPEWRELTGSSKPKFKREMDCQFWLTLEWTWTKRSFRWKENCQHELVLIPLSKKDRRLRLPNPKHQNSAFSFRLCKGCDL